MDIEGSKVFVTGGAGFIGSHLVESLIHKGADVKIYDNFSSGSYERLESINGSFEVVEGNILEKEKLKSEMKGYDIVSHQAAQLEITECVDDPVYDLESNTVGTLNVFDAAVENGVKKVVNASSACVYGEAEYTPQDERHPQNPNWAYGVSKLAAEKYGHIYCDLYPISIVSLRYAITYGEREWYGRVLTIFLKRLLNGEPPVVFGKGEQERDFTYVGDLVRLHNTCIERDDVNDEVFNVSTGKATKIRELAESMCQLAREVGKPVGEPVYEDVGVGERSELVEDDRQRLPSELQRMVLSTSKAEEILDWEPEVSLDEGLLREYRWLEQNAERWTEMSY